MSRPDPLPDAPAPEHAALDAVADLLADPNCHSTQLVTPAGSRPVPAELLEVLAVLTANLRAGHPVTVHRRPQLIGTTTAAALLGVSRPTLVKMLEAGTIPHERIANHRRVRLSDVLAFRGPRD
jgi:excisionase family DNA binding protein